MRMLFPLLFLIPLFPQPNAVHICEKESERERDREFYDVVTDNLPLQSWRTSDSTRQQYVQ
jgi:hypothetical protein